MGLSGESFRLFFNRQDPDQGVYVVAHNPLRAASSALGYDPNVLSATDFAPAVEQLRQSLEEGKGPPILHGRLDWVVVESYDPASGEYGVWRPGGRGERWPEAELRANWLAEAGLLELGLTGHYHFVIGEKKREPDPEEAAMGSLHRGIRFMFRRTRVDDCAPGLAAYQELLMMVSRRRRQWGQQAYDFHKYAQWKQCPQEYVLASRESLVRYLDLIKQFFPEEEERQHFQRAVRHYQTAVETLQGLPSVPAPAAAVLAKPPETPAEEKTLARTVKRLQGDRRRAARQLKRLYYVEREAIEELERAVWTAERKRTQRA